LSLSREFRVALPWEFLYADDLVVIAETEDDLIKRLNEWKDNVENGGMKVNMNKTKVMITGEQQKVTQVVRWPCGGCGKGVGNNSTQCTANPELVGKFCYLGDMLSIDGFADAAVDNRIETGWNKFTQLVPVLTNKDISLIVRKRLYSSCVRSSMLHRSETWPIRKENKKAILWQRLPCDAMTKVNIQTVNITN